MWLALDTGVVEDWSGFTSRRWVRKSVRLALDTGVVDDLPDVCPVCHTTVGALAYVARTRHRCS